MRYRRRSRYSSRRPRRGIRRRGGRRLRSSRGRVRVGLRF